MAYNLTRVRKEFNDVCNKAGVTVTVPVTLNGRLTRTLGRVKLQRDAGCDNWYPIGVEFSRQLLETASDKSINDVIRHEAAHLIATVRTGKDCGHNEIFKDVCAEIGTKNDTVATKVERTVSEEQLYKYSVYCDGGCGGAFIGGYSRMSNTLKQLSLCSCAKCGQSKLRYIQNW